MVVTLSNFKRHLKHELFTSKACLNIYKVRVCYGCLSDASFVDINRPSPFINFTNTLRTIVQGPPLFREMPPLSTLSQSEIQLLNDPTKSVKRAQLASLCRKVSLKVKGTVLPLVPFVAKADTKG